MNLILQVLTGTLPPFLAKRKAPRKRSPEHLEAARSYWRQRRAAQTKEERDTEYLRKKEILASLSDQEYARRRALATANMQRARAKKKLNATTKGIAVSNELKVTGNLTRPWQRLSAKRQRLSGFSTGSEP